MDPRNWFGMARGELLAILPLFSIAAHPPPPDALATSRASRLRYINNGCSRTFSAAPFFRGLSIRLRSLPMLAVLKPKRLSFLAVAAAGLPFAALLSGCGENASNAKPETPANTPARPVTAPSTGATRHGNVDGAPVPTLPATGAEQIPKDPPAAPHEGESAPKDAGCKHLPKILSIERWNNTKLGAANTLQSPESVAQDPQTGDLYVSNVGPGGAPAALDGNGYITQLSAKGTVLSAKRFPPEGGKLNGPKGIAVQGDLLWVVDIDTVRAYDLRGKEGNQLKSFSVPGAQFANDIAVGADGSLYISDTAQNFIYLYFDDGVAAGMRKTITKKATGANGLAWNAKTGKLLCCGVDFGGAPLKILEIDVNGVKDGDATVKDFSEPLGMLDGLAALPSGGMLVSDWKTQAIWWVSADGKTREKALEGFIGPADFTILKDQKTLVIPDMGRSEIVVVTFEKALD